MRPASYAINTRIISRLRKVNAFTCLATVKRLYNFIGKSSRILQSVRTILQVMWRTNYRTLWDQLMMTE